MLPTIDAYKQTLHMLWYLISGMNVGAVSIFAFPLLTGLSTPQILDLLAIVAVIGLPIGLHFQFRSKCGSTTAVFNFFYTLFAMEIMFSGGAAALALKIAGRPDLCWVAFYANAVFVALSLLAGIVREGLKLGLWNTDNSDSWKQKLEKYIDDAKHQVSPALMSDLQPASKKYSLKSTTWIVAVGGVNIPLLFEIYGGGRNNVMLFAAPVSVALFVYLNIRNVGPGALRLWLLRRLEKSAGRPFINADYEQIQELRRTFFLSRWLMKDYVAPVCAAPDQAQVSERKTPKQLKRRRKS